MKTSVVVLAIVALAACSSRTGKSNEEGPINDSTSAASNVVDNWPGYPKTQPDGSPLTADYCSKAGVEPGSPFDNTKTCLMVACDAGDKASCAEAATFKSNIWPDGEPPENANLSD